MAMETSPLFPHSIGSGSESFFRIRIRIQHMSSVADPDLGSGVFLNTGCGIGEDRRCRRGIYTFKHILIGKKAPVWVNCRNMYDVRINQLYNTYICINVNKPKPVRMKVMRKHRKIVVYTPP